MESKVKTKRRGKSLFYFLKEARQSTLLNIRFGLMFILALSSNTFSCDIPLFNLAISQSAKEIQPHNSL